MARFRSQSLWLSIVEKSSVPTLPVLWHLGQQCNSSTASLGVSSHSAQVRTNKKRSGGSCHDCRGNNQELSSETPRDLQVRMLSHKALSVSDLEWRRETNRDGLLNDYLYTV